MCHSPEDQPLFCPRTSARCIELQKNTAPTLDASSTLVLSLAAEAYAVGITPREWRLRSVEELLQGCLSASILSFRFLQRTGRSLLVVWSLHTAIQSKACGYQSYLLCIEFCLSITPISQELLKGTQGLCWSRFMLCSLPPRILLVDYEVCLSLSIMHGDCLS